MGKAYLILENGTVFEGEQFGAVGETVGELVFTTGMIDYLETLNDPSYSGQIVMQTFPLMGNYGVVPVESDDRSPKLKGYIVREWCEEPSNFRCEGTLYTFLLNNNIVGLCGIDTRALTKIIREHGVMNAKISLTPECDLEELKNYKIENCVKEMTCSDVSEFKAENGTCRIVMPDLGSRGTLISELTKRGCDVTVVPATYTAEQIQVLEPDGVFYGCGAGDPAENTEIIAEIKKLFDKNVPMFGIGLGHQLIALAAGAKTVKLKYGHRGGNQPVQITDGSRTYITAQNHGYSVDPETLPENAEIYFKNINDGTCEGINYTNKPVFSVQFNPEVSFGPNDQSFLYEKFIENAKKGQVK